MPYWFTPLCLKPIQRSPRGAWGPLVALILPLDVLWYTGFTTMFSMVKRPTGVGVLGSPMATGQRPITWLPSIRLIWRLPSSRRISRTTGGSGGGGATMAVLASAGGAWASARLAPGVSAQPRLATSPSRAREPLLGLVKRARGNWRMAGAEGTGGEGAQGR